MKKSIWNALQFYENTDALRQLAKEKIGFHMSTEQAQEIRACLYQAREYYKSAEDSELAIRPLLIFYGMSNLAKALTMLRGGKERSRLNLLPQKHGLKLAFEFGWPIDRASCRIVGASGTFQDFNDVAAQNEDFHLDGFIVPVRNSMSSVLAGRSISLIDLWSYIPELWATYRCTFSQDCQVIPLNIRSGAGGYMLELSELSFWNQERRDIILTLFKEIGTVPSSGLSVYVDTKQATKLPGVCLPPLSRPLIGDIKIEMLPRGSPLYPLSPLSVTYLGMFILGSIARYRPDAWVGFTRLGKGDRALAYVDRFVDYSEEYFPREIFYKMEGVT